MCKTLIKKEDSKYYELAARSITWKMGHSKSFKTRRKNKDVYVYVCVCIYTATPTEFH